MRDGMAEGVERRTDRELTDPAAAGEDAPDHDQVAMGSVAMSSRLGQTAGPTPAAQPAVAGESDEALGEDLGRRDTAPFE